LHCISKNRGDKRSYTENFNEIKDLEPIAEKNRMKISF